MVGSAPKGAGLDALVVIPTYNERDNIERVIRALLALPAGLGVLVVDDDSPDGTGRIVDEIRAREPRVHVIHRSGKFGLGTAYIAGFKWALANTDARFIFEMDADFSHNPRRDSSLLGSHSGRRPGHRVALRRGRHGGQLAALAPDP